MKRWDMVGLVGAIAVSCFDLWTFHLGGLAPEILLTTLGGQLVLFSFVVGYGALGFVGGRLWMARTRTKADADQIRAQLEELERARLRLVQSEKLAAVGRLAAGIAHEVRNPLGVIRASASMVGEELEPGTDDHRALELIVEETDRLDALIAALLRFAQPAKMSAKTTALRPVIDKAVELTTAMPERASLEIEADVDNVSVQADPDLLTQLVLGLLVNAAEAGAKKIAIEAVRRDDRVELHVCDDGSGVSEEDAAQIFEPFFTTKSTGTGLGLPMALRIVEAHGGSLELDRTRETGACFSLRLPVSGPSVRTEAA